jgi:predicted amidohydrolase YtcJ
VLSSHQSLCNISCISELVFKTDKDPGQWVRGGGWNNDFWGGDFPTAGWLDNISPDNPVSFYSQELNLF